MNKRDLIDAISGRLGDKKSATEAVNAVLETIQSAVANGDKVAITGFGVFEKSERPARTARNPSTGATIEVPEVLGAEVPSGRRLQGPGQRQARRSNAEQTGLRRPQPWPVLPTRLATATSAAGRSGQTPMPETSPGPPGGPGPLAQRGLDDPVDQLRQRQARWPPTSAGTPRPGSSPASC